MARIITYKYEGPFDELKMEKLLRKAKELGVVGEYDTGRGDVVWFEGRPGPALRSVRTDVLGLIAEHKRLQAAARAKAKAKGGAPTRAARREKP